MSTGVGYIRVAIFADNTEKREQEEEKERTEGGEEPKIEDLGEDEYAEKVMELLEEIS